MAVVVRHKKTATAPDNPQAEVNKGEWNDSHDVSGLDFSVMGIYVGSTEPTLKTYAQWLVSRTGYWAWIDISGEAAGVTATIMTANASGSVNPLAAGYSRYFTAVINPANAVGSIAKLVATVAGDAVTAVVNPANASGMVAALTASYIRYMAGVVGTANSASAINKLVASYARYMTASVGVAAAVGAVNALVATVSGALPEITAGTISYRGTSGNLTPALPAGLTSGDLLICVSYQNGANSLSGYTALQSSTGTAMLFYKTAGGSESSPTVAVGGGGYAVMIRVSGWSAFGTASDTAGYDYESTSFSAATGGSVTTTVNNEIELIVCIGTDYGNNDGEYQWPNTNPHWNTVSGFANTLIASDAHILGNNAIGLALYSGVKAVAGSTGTTSTQFDMTYDTNPVDTLTQCRRLTIKP